MVAYIYTNKNLQYAAAAPRMVCKSAYLGQGSHKKIGPKRLSDRSKEAYSIWQSAVYRGLTLPSSVKAIEARGLTLPSSVKAIEAKRK